MKKTIAGLILIPATKAGLSQSVFEITGTVIDSRNDAIACASSSYCRQQRGHVYDLPESQNIHFSPVLKVYHFFFIVLNITYQFKISSGHLDYLKGTKSIRSPLIHGFRMNLVLHHLEWNRAKSLKKPFTIK